MLWHDRTYVRTCCTRCDGSESGCWTEQPALFERQCLGVESVAMPTWCGSPDRQVASSSYDVIVKMAEDPQQKKPRVQSENYKDRFLAVFPELVDCVTKDGLNSSEIAVAMQHFKSVSIFASFDFSLPLRIN